MFKKNKKKAFTLPEVLIAVSLFAIVATISSTIYLDLVNLEKKSVVHEVFFEDGKIILQQISNLIQDGAIDYEEYFSKYVLAKNNEINEFGRNYGVYSSRFYDPGRKLDGTPSTNPDDLGVECSFPPSASIDECEIFYTLSTDLNTGQNPFRSNGSDYLRSNAFCDSPNTPNCLNLEGLGIVSELFLINSLGTEKTILAKQKTGSTGDDDYAVGIVKLNGIDLDQNGIIDTWTCFEEYTCETVKAQINQSINIKLPKVNNLIVPYNLKTSHFVPISPKRSTVKDLVFIISPLEDPFKAFNEPTMQAHPSVTVIMKIGLSEEEKKNYPSDFQDIIIQGTFTSGVLTKINAYPPTKDLSWIKDLSIETTP
jgi:prepilin-type N-terminal cleavage/methylation domain-containing protein